MIYVCVTLVTLCALLFVLLMAGYAARLHEENDSLRASNYFDEIVKHYERTGPN